MPNSVTNIGVDAFNNCTGLISVTIPDSVTSIKQSAFEGCTNLASVTIPNSVTSIWWNAFKNCTGLISVKFESTIASKDFISSAFDGDLCAKYLAGGRGTYTTRNPGYHAVWTKQ